MNKKSQDYSIFMIVFFCLVFVLGVGLTMYYDTVGAGFVGVTDTFGKVGDVILQPGIHGTGIFTSTIELDARLQRQDYQANAASKDLQVVKTNLSVNYKLNPASAIEIYKTIGQDYQDIIIYPIVQEAVKSITASYTAEELITKRAEVKESITNIIINKVQDKGLIITEVALTDFDFSEEFNKAIEAKQTAEQEALKAVNEKRKLITESEARSEKQRLESDANAYQIRVEADSKAYSLRVVREELEKSNDLIEYTKIIQWGLNGAKVPNTVLGSDNNLLVTVN
jgi:regulator of protease activity HflC (stomatin/prohibitin superfamily)